MKILIDTREQQPLVFDEIETSIATLKTGDYTLEGLEDKVCFERKASVVELCNNISQKRFWAEMERMRPYKYRFLICEFPFSDIENWPYSSGLSKKIMSKLRISVKYLLKCIGDIEIKYGISVLFCGSPSGASAMITTLSKRIKEDE